MTAHNPEFEIARGHRPRLQSEAGLRREEFYAALFAAEELILNVDGVEFRDIGSADGILHQTSAGGSPGVVRLCRLKHAADERQQGGYRDENQQDSYKKSHNCRLFSCFAAFFIKPVF